MKRRLTREEYRVLGEYAHGDLQDAQLNWSLGERIKKQGDSKDFAQFLLGNIREWPVKPTPVPPPSKPGKRLIVLPAAPWRLDWRWLVAGMIAAFVIGLVVGMSL